MGKFNSADGVNFSRTIQDIVNDYARFLLEKKIITDEEFSYYIQDGKIELLDNLMDKIYETEIYKGVEIDTLDGYYHFCRFIIKDFHRKPVWNKFVMQMFLGIEKNKDSCHMASRSLGKSFHNYSLYPLFKMFKYRGTKFLHVSNIPTQCVENLRIPKEIIDTNEMLYQKKEISKGKELKWTERQIEYNGGMLITLSAGTSPKGLHVHYAMVDDILTEEAQLNDVEMENYIFGQLYPTVQREKGRLIVTGTPLHRKDIYHLLMGDKPDCEGDPIGDGRISAKGFFSQMIPIAYEDNDGVLHSNFPEIYSDEEIAQIRQKVGEIKFQREYMLNCIDESMTIFSEHLISTATDINEKYIYSPSDPNQRFVIGVDVATSGEVSADFSAFVTLEIIDREVGRKKVIRNIVHVKGMPVAEQVETISQLAAIFNNAVVVVEKNNVGVALIQELAKKNVNVEEFITSVLNKEGMIRYLVNELTNKNLWLPETTNEIARLKKEMTNFGVKKSRSGRERMEALSGHDDMVMALAMANQTAQNLGGLPIAVLQKDRR